ncbi:TA system VapC family ribonuclease toxin [Pseudoxanthomonas putridarboris]|uniref:Ribonuclease VapC n=1 Tax=Pseudoxanthomonas putridarboris TaxID=752605 RepID=A0ABU9J484_9GAMM
MTPDVNVLLAASRRDHPHHTVALAWLEQAVAATESAPLMLQPMVVASFLRLATHPKIFPTPTPIDRALAFIEALLAAPGVGMGVLDGEWQPLSQLCRDRDLRANDLPDAWLAAAVIQQGEHLVSFDGDFKRLLPRTRFTRLAP